MLGQKNNSTEPADAELHDQITNQAKVQLTDTSLSGICQSVSVTKSPRFAYFDLKWRVKPSMAYYCFFVVTMKTAVPTNNAFTCFDFVGNPFTQ